jgi:predicted SnoaL-like aldol condensation-catalyzing enzyme
MLMSAVGIATEIVVTRKPHASHTLHRRVHCVRPSGSRHHCRADGSQQESGGGILRVCRQQKGLRGRREIPRTKVCATQPQAADGPEGLKAYIAFLRDKFPDAHSDVIRVFADGDYVIQHVHSVPTPGSRGNAIVNIYKLENGKIVEHWDVIEPVPEKSANNNTMF